MRQVFRLGVAAFAEVALGSTAISVFMMFARTEAGMKIIPPWFITQVKHPFATQILAWLTACALTSLPTANKRCRREESVLDTEWRDLLPSTFSAAFMHVSLRSSVGMVRGASS